MQTFNVGDNPQVGQRWQPNLVFEIDGIGITLKEIAVERNNAYRFTFKGPGNLETVSVEMPDYPSIGGGGGASGYPGAQSTKEAESSISFTSLPTGELKFYVTAISVYEEPVRLTQSWQPSQPTSRARLSQPARSVWLAPRAARSRTYRHSRKSYWFSATRRSPAQAIGKPDFSPAQE